MFSTVSASMLKKSKHNTDLTSGVTNVHRQLIETSSHDQRSGVNAEHMHLLHKLFCNMICMGVNVYCCGTDETSECNFVFGVYDCLIDCNMFGLFLVLICFSSLARSGSYRGCLEDSFITTVIIRLSKTSLTKTLNVHGISSDCNSIS